MQRPDQFRPRDSENWSRRRWLTSSPPRLALRNLTSPLVLVDQGREIASLLERLVEAASRLRIQFPFRSGALGIILV